MSSLPYVVLMLAVSFSLFNFTQGVPTLNETETSDNFDFDLKEAIKKSTEQNMSSVVDQNSMVSQNNSVNQNSSQSMALAKSLSIRARFFRIRIKTIIRNLNNTISDAKKASEEFSRRLNAATEDFTNKLNEDIQLLRAGVGQAVAEAVAKLQSKAVGVYECSQQQIGIADSWIKSSLESLGRCSMPLATKASNAVGNITQSVQLATEQLVNLVNKMDSCTNINNTEQFETCLSDLLNEAHRIEIRLATQIGYLMNQAGQLLLILPGTLAACSGSLLVNISTGITQSIVSVGECAVGIAM